MLIVLELIPEEGPFPTIPPEVVIVGDGSSPLRLPPQRNLMTRLNRGWEGRGDTLYNRIQPLGRQASPS